MINIRNTIAFAITALLFFGAYKFLVTNEMPNDEQVETTDHYINLVDIHKLGKFQLLNFEFTDVVEHTLQRDFLPNGVCHLFVSGRAVITVDLSNITTEDITYKGDSIYIKLPAPILSDAYVDHSKSYVTNVDYGLLDTDKMIDSAYKDAELSVRKIAGSDEYINTAKNSAISGNDLTRILSNVSKRPVKLYF